VHGSIGSTLLLATVEPIATRSNVPVIEVTEFATLAKLAERCGQLVMHWSRSDVETFVILDEGTTYRFRTCSAETPPIGEPRMQDPLTLTTPRTSNSISVREMLVAADCLVPGRHVATSTLRNPEPRIATRSSAVRHPHLVLRPSSCFPIKRFGSMRHSARMGPSALPA